MKHSFVKIFSLAIVGTAIAVLSPSQVHAQTVPPSASPAAGEYHHNISVSLSTTELSTYVIKFTTDGSIPACPPSAHGTNYSSPIALSSDTTIKAITCVLGSQSIVETFTYTFTSPSSIKPGGFTTIPSDLPNAPTCDTDPAVCPPNTPDAGGVTTPLVAPAFGTLLANDTQAFTRDLFLGTSGSDVVFLQSFLIRHNAGVKARALAAVGPTGTFGPLTQAAVIEFQIETGITPAQGYVGVKTRARINALAGILPSPLMTTTLLATPTPLVAPSKGGVGVGVPEYGVATY